MMEEHYRNSSVGYSGEMPPPTKVHIKKSTGGVTSGDDMTEDEVAIMVKNALRKARKAMHDSTPLHSPNASSEEWSEPDFYTPPRRKMGSGIALENTSGTDGAVLSPADDDDDELAKRIEAEINSARAFAEHAYFGTAGTETTKEEPLSPTCAASVKSDATEIHTNTTSAQQSPKSPLGYNTLSPRARRKAARKSSTASSPRHMNTNKKLDISIPPIDDDDNEAVPTPELSRSPSPQEHKKLSPTKSSTPRNENREMDVQVDVAQTTTKDGEAIPDRSTLYKPTNDAEKRRFKEEAEALINEKMKTQTTRSVDKPISPKSPKSPRSSAPKDNQVLSTNSTILNSKVKAHATSNLTKQQLSGSRQVIFRHPYPLPPPPVAPRSEDTIINENAVPEKSFNIKLVEPDAELDQLIQQTRDEQSIVRRSNACGAIKVLASHKTNKAKLARTNGLLDALIYASVDDAVDSDALDARTRAVTTLLFLSEAKDNRIIVAKHPGVLDVLLKVIEEDTGEARLRACSALATLAKTAQNRSDICNIENLAIVLSNLMVQNATKKEEKENPAMEEVVDSNSVDSKSESQDEEGAALDGGSYSNTFSGSGISGSGTYYSETNGSGSFTEDDSFSKSYGSSEDGSTFSNDLSTSSSDMSASNDMSMSNDLSASNDGSMSNGRSMSKDISMSNDRSMSTEEPPPIDLNRSIGEEEGVEMQISSLKKLNIENASDFLERSQLSACATLTHLTKHCANARLLCRNEQVLNNILFLAELLDHPLHTRCLEMVCNFTRFPSNNAKLASMPRVIEILTAGGKSKIAEDRLWSTRTIQNLCSDASSKVGLATGSLLSLLSACAMRKDHEEQLAAVGALMNLATEPGSIVPLTNTKTVVATLVHLAHSPNTPASVRKIACDSLATIGLWLQTLASAGTVPDSCPLTPLPTHTATGWLRWD